MKTDEIHEIMPHARLGEGSTAFAAAALLRSMPCRRIKQAIAAASVFVAFVAIADVQYLWWEAQRSPVWKDAAGNVVTWANGNDAVWKSVWNGNTSLMGTIVKSQSRAILPVRFPRCRASSAH